MKIGRIIRDAREDLDLTQKDMAEQIPMNQSNYSKIERDLQEPTLEQLKRIIEILRLDANELLGIRVCSNTAQSRFCDELKVLYEKYLR